MLRVSPARPRKATKMNEVYVSSVIKASPDRVWSVIRNFNELPIWHPLVAESRIETGAPADQLGCVRNFTMKDGGRIREQLLSLSDYDYCCKYSILESPMGVKDYVATLRLHPVTDAQHTFIEWSAEFDCAEEDADRLIAKIGDEVFQGGFDALKTRFGG